MTLLSPLSPFGPVPALLLFPSPGRRRLQSNPSRGSLVHIAVSQLPAQDVLVGLVRPALLGRLLCDSASLGP